MGYLLMQGNSRRLPLPDQSVGMCITSPPYWGLRSYLDDDDPLKALELGNEPTPEEYVANMVAVFREVRRVLHPSGTVWLNMGDSYSSHPSGSAKPRSGQGNGRGLFHLGGAAQDHYFASGRRLRRTEDVPGLKPKDLCMIPARLALALQADGWWLRSEITWCKTSPMPESVTDRPTSATEKVYLLAKSPNYYYDAEAVRVEARNTGGNGSWGARGDMRRKPDERTDLPVLEPGKSHWSGRNLWNYWVLGSESFPGSHFATYPRKLVEPCIRAGTSERGCCPRCGAPWVREVERSGGSIGKGSWVDHAMDASNGKVGSNSRVHSGNDAKSYRVTTLGWHASCPHGLDPVPPVVFDPFCGSGTTLVVAEALGRRGIGVELSAEYLAIARRRLDHPHAAVPRPGKAEYHPLFGDAP